MKTRIEQLTKTTQTKVTLHAEDENLEVFVMHKRNPENRNRRVEVQFFCPDENNFLTIYLTRKQADELQRCLIDTAHWADQL
jgi:hypothetical protein